MEFEPITCCTCGTTFGLLPIVSETLRESGDRFICPNGHGLSFKPGEVTRLRRRVGHLERVNESLNRDVERERRRRAAFQGVITKMRNNGADPAEA